MGKHFARQARPPRQLDSFAASLITIFYCSFFPPLLPAQQALEAEERKIKSMTRQPGFLLLPAAGERIVFESAQRVAHFAGDLSTPAFLKFHFACVFARGKRGGMTLWNYLLAFLSPENATLFILWRQSSHSTLQGCVISWHTLNKWVFQQRTNKTLWKQKLLVEWNSHNGGLGNGASKRLSLALG